MEPVFADCCHRQDIREQIDALKGVNETRARGLQLSLGANQPQLQDLRQDNLMGKSAAAVQGEMRARQNMERRVSAFRRQDRRTDGLMRAERNMDGDVVGGIDPLTGERRGPAAGEGRGEQGLTTGGLSGTSEAAPGYTKLVNDLNPEGGLSTSGGVAPDLFAPGQSSAERYLRSRPTVEQLMARHKGDPAHDPMARLRLAPTFPNLKEKLASEFPGTSGAAMHPAKLRPGPGAGEASIRSVGQANAAKLKVMRETNQLLGGILSLLSEGLHPG